MFKKLTCLLVAAAGLLAGVRESNAQTYGTITVSALRSTVAASVTTNIGTILDLRGNRNVTFQLSGNGVSNVVSQVSVRCAKGLDGGTNFETTASFTVPLAVGGTANYQTNYNVDVGAVGYVKIVDFVCSTNTCTNLLLQVAMKPGS